MKKHVSLSIFALLFITCFALAGAGCSQTAVDEHGCYADFDSAVKASGKSGNDIVVIATMDGDDVQSADFLQKVVYSANFSSVTDLYSVVLMDFSKKAYDATVAQDEEDKKAVKLAHQKEVALNKNVLTAKLLNISQTPSFYLLTKDGCFVSNVEYIEEINSPQDFLSLLANYQSQASAVNVLVAKTSSGPSQDRLSAIEELYDSTESIYRPFLKDFISKAIKLASSAPELKSKFLIAQTDAECTEAFLSGNTQAAVQGYVKLAGNKEITPGYRQQAWYMAGYLLAMSDTSKYDLIIQYLENAVQAAPDSADALSIKRAINEISGN